MQVLKPKYRWKFRIKEISAKIEEYQLPSIKSFSLYLARHMPLPTPLGQTLKIGLHFEKGNQNPRQKVHINFGNHCMHQMHT